MKGSASGAEDVQRISRWEGAGGLWEVVARGPRAVTVSLCRCDGGEEVDRFTSADERLLAYVAGRDRSDE
jgi:hypothetical protein